MTRLAYLVNQYPKGSHTFIRREILALEALGLPVLRVAIREAAEVLEDPADRMEHARTHYCLKQPWLRLLADTLAVVLSAPLRFLAALRRALDMYRVSDRGLLRHLAYLVEASHLTRVFRREGIGHVHVHFGTNAAAVARLVEALGGPGYSVTIHGPGEFDAPVGLSLGAKVADARFVVAISHYCSGQLRRWAEPSDWEKIAVIRCGVDASFVGSFEPPRAESHGFVSVGRLTPQKGHLLLLEAFRQVLEQEPDATLTIVGDGELRALVEGTVRAKELGSRVRLTGWLAESEVRREMLASRAVVLSSFAEGLPVVLMEALALGRPVVSTAIAGIPELVRDGEIGWLACAGDATSLRDAMVAALRAPADRLAAMASAGRSRVLAMHRVDDEARRLADLFRPWLEPGCAASTDEQAPDRPGEIERRAEAARLEAGRGS